jgi:glycosyltransferase involved in cell wall biosynthesis
MPNILLIEPFFTGSHKAWAEGVKQRSSHNIELLTMPGRHWKWRMHGGAITLANQFLAIDFEPDLIVATDMLDLTTFQALTRSKTADIPVVAYFHENQLTYPWSPNDQDVTLKRDNHYSFINYTSALAADQLLFNSSYHRTAFIEALPAFLRQFPDGVDLEGVEQIEQKSQVLHLGLDLARFDPFKQRRSDEKPPLILWNHRWEYDKNPEDFFRALEVISAEGHDFELAVLGESYKKLPPAFDRAKQSLDKHIVHWGFVDSFEAYATWLWEADILPVTSNQDFFGVSVVEAMYCDVAPILPNRLAFPEHLPSDAAERKHVYYTTFEELVQQIKGAVAHISEIRRNQVSRHVKRYDWQNMASAYDAIFDQMAR